MSTQQTRSVVLAHAAMVADDTPVAVEVDGHDVVVVGDGGTVRAYDGRCPHRGTSLAEGEVIDGTLVCPGHGWRFEVATGANIDPSLPCLHPVTTRVEHDHVIVDPTSLPGAKQRDTTRAARSLRELPGPRRLPPLGNAAQLDRTRLHEVLEAWQGTYGAAYRIALGRQQVLVTSDPRLVRDASRRRRRLPADQRHRGRPGRDNQIGVFAAEGDDWRRQRALVARALDARHVRGFLPTLLRITDRLRQRWNAAARTGAVVDLRRDLMRYTVDVTAGLVFGHDIDTLSGDDDVIQRHLAHLFPTLNRRMMSPVAYWRVIRLPADRRYDAAFDAVRVYYQARIADTRNRIAAEPQRAHQPTNLLEALIAATTDDHDPLTEDELIANMLTVLVAGEDTTASTIAWAVHLLTRAPDIRERLHDEVAATDRDELGVACRDTGRLPYTDAVVSETMRLKPVGPVIFPRGKP